MIVGGVSIEEIDSIYQRMGIKELFVLPWYEWKLANPKSGALVRKVVGMITGAIEEFPEYPGLSGFLEHFIVLPEAENPLAVMQQMPKEAVRLLRARGIARILLCIDESDERREGLDAWARRCKFKQYAIKDGRRWYVQPLTKENHPRNGQGQSEASDPRSAPAAASPAASGS